jgi:hypothetical protein
MTTLLQNERYLKKSRTNKRVVIPTGIRYAPDSHKERITVFTFDAASMWTI